MSTHKYDLEESYSSSLASSFQTALLEKADFLICVHRNVCCRNVTKSTLVLTHFDCFVSVDCVSPTLRLMMSILSPSMQETRKAQTLAREFFSFSWQPLLSRLDSNLNSNVLEWKESRFHVLSLLLSQGSIGREVIARIATNRKRFDPKGNHIFFEIYFGLSLKDPCWKFREKTLLLESFRSQEGNLSYVPAQWRSYTVTYTHM